MNNCKLVYVDGDQKNIFINYLMNGSVGYCL